MHTMLVNFISMNAMFYLSFPSVGVLGFLVDLKIALKRNRMFTAATTVKMEKKKKRNPNFSPQDSLLLTQVMGATHPGFI